MRKWMDVKIDVKKLVWLLLSALIAFAVSFMQTASIAGRCVNLIVLVASYALIRYTASRDKAIDLLTAVFSAVFSVCYVLSKSIVDYGDLDFVAQNTFLLAASVLRAVGLWILFYFVIRMAAILIAKHPIAFLREGTEQRFCKHFLLYGFLIIFLCWLPWILLNYPGTFCYDARYQLMGFFGDSVFNAHHPPLSTYIMGALMLVGDFFLDKNFGCFLYLLLQTCAGGGNLCLRNPKAISGWGKIPLLSAAASILRADAYMGLLCAMV